MRFSSLASLTLAGVAFTGLATAATIDARAAREMNLVARDSKLVARDGPFEDLDLDDDFWEKMGEYCGEDAEDKRSLHRRASAPDGYTVVSPGNLESFYKLQSGSGAWTDFLVTCTGVVITGETDDPIKKDKVLAHFFSAPASVVDDQWKKVTDAVSGLSNMKGYLSLPDPADLVDGLDEDDLKKVNDRMISLVKDHTGSDPTVRYHNMKAAQNREGDAGTMQLNGDLSVRMEGQDVAFGS